MSPHTSNANFDFPITPDTAGPEFSPILNFKEKKVEKKSIEIRGKGLMDTVLVKVE